MAQSTSARVAIMMAAAASRQGVRLLMPSFDLTSTRGRGLLEEVVASRRPLIVSQLSSNTSAVSNQHSRRYDCYLRSKCFLVSKQQDGSLKYPGFGHLLAWCSSAKKSCLSSHISYRNRAQRVGLGSNVGDSGGRARFWYVFSQRRSALSFFLFRWRCS